MFHRCLTATAILVVLASCWLVNAADKPAVKDPIAVETAKLHFALCEVEVQIANVKLEQARVKLEETETQFKNGLARNAELQMAKLETQLAELQLKAVAIRLEQAKLSLRAIE